MNIEIIEDNRDLSEKTADIVVEIVKFPFKVVGNIFEKLCNLE